MSALSFAPAEAAPHAGIAALGCRALQVDVAFVSLLVINGRVRRK